MNLSKFMTILNNYKVHSKFEKIKTIYNTINEVKWINKKPNTYLVLYKVFNDLFPYCMNYNINNYRYLHPKILQKLIYHYLYYRLLLWTWGQ